MRRLFRVHLPRPLFGNAGGHAPSAGCSLSLQRMIEYSEIIIIYFANHVIEKVKEVHVETGFQTHRISMMSDVMSYLKYMG